MKKITSAFLLVVVLYATTISSQHHVAATDAHATLHHDDCDHHFHQNHQHGICHFCKMEVGVVFTIAENVPPQLRVFFVLIKLFLPTTTFFALSQNTITTRGPPIVA